MSESQEPAGDDGLDALDEYLSSDRSPPECMQLSGLDGFLTGVAVGPEMILPSEWLPVVWGGEEPTFADADEARKVLGQIMSRYNDILSGVAQQAYQPILWTVHDGTVVATDWAEGFALSIGLRPKAWDPLLGHKRHAGLLLPILGLCLDENDDSVLGLDVDTSNEIFEQAPDMLAGCVTEIAAFWRKRRDKAQGDATVARKVGRNEPCPCGSGRKFKKCCGA